MRLLFFIFLFSCPFLFFSQKEENKKTIPRFTKMNIGTSNCLAYFPADKPIFELAYSQDSSKITTTEIQIDAHYFSLIHVDIKNAITDSLEQEQLLVNYLDFLRDNFSIVQSAGYGKGHTLSTYPKAHGMIDFWKDVEGNEYSVKGWVTKNTVSIFMVYGTGEYPIYNVKELFFNGLRFE